MHLGIRHSHGQALAGETDRPGQLIGIPRATAKFQPADAEAFRFAFPRIMFDGPLDDGKLSLSVRLYIMTSLAQLVSDNGCPQAHKQKREAPDDFRCEAQIPREQEMDGANQSED